MYCTRCGVSLPDGARICAECGEAPMTPRRHSPWLAGFAVVCAIVIAAGVLAALELKGSLTNGSALSTRETSSVPAVPPTSRSSTSTPADFAQVYRRLSSGVVPITAVVCDGTGTGSGFLVDSRTVVTAAHVVDGAVAVSVQVDGRPHTAWVTRIDPSIDLALLQIGQVAAGSSLQIAGTDPAGGTSVAALGYPEGTPLRMTEGSVVGRDRSVSILDGSTLHGLLETDADAQRGNSGGPLIDRQGRVVGVVIAGDPRPSGQTFAVPASIIGPRVSEPDSMPIPAAVQCDGRLLGPEDDTAAQFPVEDLSREVARTLADYFVGINTGDYRLAYDQLSPRIRGGSRGFESFADGVSTSYDFGFDILDADLQPDYAWVWLEFVSLQDPALGPDGESCTEWSLVYEFVRADDRRFLIDRVSGRGDTSGHQPCA